MLPNNAYGGLSKPSSSGRHTASAGEPISLAASRTTKLDFLVFLRSGACRSRKRFNWMISFQVRWKVGKRKVGGKSVRRKGGKSVRRKGGKSGCC